jgi:hypothetical protein
VSAIFQKTRRTMMIATKEVTAVSAERLVWRLKESIRMITDGEYVEAVESLEHLVNKLEEMNVLVFGNLIKPEEG